MDTVGAAGSLVYGPHNERPRFSPGRTERTDLYHTSDLQ